MVIAITGEEITPYLSGRTTEELAAEDDLRRIIEAGVKLQSREPVLPDIS